MKVLFDFEINERLKPTYSTRCYETIRSFFLQRFALFELELMLYVEAGEYPVVIVFVSEDLIRVVPFNIPDHLMDKMNRCVTKQHRETMLAVLSSIDDDAE